MRAGFRVIVYVRAPYGNEIKRLDDCSNEVEIVARDRIVSSLRDCRKTDVHIARKERKVELDQTLYSIYDVV